MIAARAAALLLAATVVAVEPAPVATDPATATAAAPAPFRDAEDLGGWMAAYYQAPDPARLPQAFALVQAADRPPEMAANERLLAVFAARLFVADPTLLALCAAPGRGRPATDAPVLLWAAWLADTDATRAWLAAEIARTPEGTPGRERLQGLIDRRPPALETVPADPAMIDAWWSAFFATGEARWVELVIAAALGPEDQPATVAARASLAFGAQEHPAVAAAITAAAAGRAGAEAEALRRLLRGAVTPRAAPLR